MITTGFAVGALAPVVLGALKDSLGSLQETFPILAAIWLACGIIMLVVAFKLYRKDYDKNKGNR